MTSLDINTLQCRINANSSKYADDETSTLVTGSTRESTKGKKSPSGKASGIVKHTFYESECVLTDQQRKLLHEKTIEGQEFRLSLLKGRTVLLCCVGSEHSKIHSYRHAKQMGVNLVVLDEPDSEMAQTLLEEGVIDAYLSCDLSPRPSVLEEVTTIIDEYFDVSGRVLSGITTLWDDAVCLSARLCDVYGVPGNSVSTIDVVHDKAASRKFFSDFPSPQCRVAITLGEAMECVGELNFPVILKPLYGAASIGVVKVDTKEDLEEAFLSAQRKLAFEHKTGGLMGLLFDDAENVGNSASSLNTFCIEEFLEGEEFDCDVVVSDGEISYSNLSDDWPVALPHFFEVGSNCPSQRPQEMKDAVTEFAATVVSALKLTTGVFHIEVIYDNRLGPVLIECNPRIGGAFIRKHHLRVFGVDLMDEAMLTAVGIPSAPPQYISPTYTSLSVVFYASKSGVLQKDVETIFQTLEKHEELESFDAKGYKAGTTVSGWDHEMGASCLGYIHYCTTRVNAGGQSYSEFYDTCIRFRDLFYSVLNENTL